MLKRGLVVATLTIRFPQGKVERYSIVDRQGVRSFDNRFHLSKMTLVDGNARVDEHPVEVAGVRC